MQPYFFPYIGYFQLIRSSEKFVFYDDVAFIKQGWINRNNILLNGKAHLFSIPVSNISSFELISQTAISYKVDWTGKFLKMIDSAYRKSPQFNSVFPKISALIESRPEFISDLAKQSIKLVFDHIAQPVDWVESSAQYENQSLKAQDRILDICKKESAATYLNPIGGLELYDKTTFANAGMELFFVKPSIGKYRQFSNEFVPGLSMMDVLMFNTPEEIARMICNYELI